MSNAWSCGNFIRDLNVVLSSYIRNMPFYAVAKGRKSGIFSTWPECEGQVKGFNGARFKKFATESEARNFVNGGSQQSAGASKQKPAFNNINRKFSTKSTANFSKNSGAARYNRSVNENDEVMRQMDKIESEVENIKNRCENRTADTRKKSNREISGTMLIEPLAYCPSSSTSQPSKRPLDTFTSEPANKRLKTVSKSNGNISYDFAENEAGFVEVYTDGACSNNGTKVARAGLGVYFGEDHPLNASEPVSGRATNNCGEIQAATKAINLAHRVGIEKLCIKTDSKFVINAITKWMTGWKKKGWKLASGQPVKNEIDFKELDKAAKQLQLKWEYVNAHKGIHGNERADQLAKEGATKYGT